MNFSEMKNAVCLAPMAGITDCTFRLLCMKMGCDFGVTEMISANGLVFSPKESQMQRQLMQKAPGETVGVQIFGCDPKRMSEAAKMICDGYDFVDINMGCPAPKIVQGGAGSALGRDRGLARLVLAAVKEASSVPVTIKIRLGWDDDSLNYMRIAEMAQEEGAAAIAVHGRTKKQMFSGKADMKPICEIVREFDIPVIANGDIASPEDAARVFEETGCAAVMIGRGSTGNPFLFRQIKQLMSEGRYDAVSYEERIGAALEHTRLMVGLKGEKVATYEMRKHVGWYIKGLKGAAAVRETINTCKSTDAILDLLADYIASLERTNEE